MPDLGKYASTLIDLSTAHLSPAAKAFLDRGRNATGGQQCLQMVEEDAEEPTRLLVMFSHDHFWLDGGGNSIIAVPHQHGWFVYAHEEFCGDDAEEIPPDLETIIFACNKAGAHWINFDADGDVYPGFPTFDDEPGSG